MTMYDNIIVATVIYTVCKTEKENAENAEKSNYFKTFSFWAKRSTYYRKPGLM